MGWARTFEYFRHRVFRTGDSTYSITAGLAMGGAVSFSPFLGTHFAQAIFGSWLIRGNMVAGFVGTAFGNPWTFPFIFYFSYTLGVDIAGLVGLSDFTELPDSYSAKENPMGFLKYMFSNPLKLLLPMTLGGYTLGFAFWFVAFAVLFYPVKWIRAAYTAQYLKFRQKKKGS